LLAIHGLEPAADRSCELIQGGCGEFMAMGRFSTAHCSFQFCAVGASIEFDCSASNFRSLEGLFRMRTWETAFAYIA